MKVEKGNTGGLNITAKLVKDKSITTLKILGEGEMKSFTNEDKATGKNVTTEKIALPVEFNGQGPEDPKTWVLNNKSLNALIDIFGAETSTWVGKLVQIQLSGDGDYRHITVDTLRTTS